MAINTSKIDSHWDTTVKDWIPEQYRGETLTRQRQQSLGVPNLWQSCLKSVVKQLQHAEECTYGLRDIFNVTSSSAPLERIEFVASLFNVYRNVGETKEDFYSRFLTIVKSKDAGTSESVIRALKTYTGDSAPVIYDESATSATFIVYTPNGLQMRRDNVRSLAPAGVLGCVGLALTTAKGKKIVTKKGQRILALDSGKNALAISKILVTEEGKILTTEENGYSIVTEGV